MPTLEEGEGVAVTTEKESSGDSQSEEMDAMAEQECFFGTNAMPNKPVCRVGRIFTQCPSKHCAALGTRPEHRHMETQPRHAAAQVTLLEASFVFLPGLRRGENSSSEQHRQASKCCCRFASSSAEETDRTPVADQRSR